MNSHTKLIHLYELSKLSFSQDLFIILIMDLFDVGQKIALLFQKNSNMVEMTCVIEKVLDDRLCLTLPQYFMRYIECLQVGSTLTAKVFSKIGTLDFNTIVISSPLEECFSIEADYNSIRLTSGEDMPAVNAVENMKITTATKSEDTKTIELSAIYVKFSSNNNYEINDNIDCYITLPKDYGIINFKAVITEQDAIYEDEYTATYTTMTDTDKQTLLYYMYMYSKDTD